MADEKEENISKTFNDIEFDKVEDKFTVTIEYDSNSELLSLKLINQTNKNVFEEQFDKEHIHKIADKCYLQPHLVGKMIMDTLSSKELTTNHVRVFVLPNIKQATTKYDELRALQRIPDAINIPTGFEPNINNNNNENNPLENCLLFVLHFSAPPFIYFNYCFIIKEKDVSQNDKLGMKINDLENENESLKDKVEAQQQQINQLTQRLQQLENKCDNESKIEEIELNLENNWRVEGVNWNVPKATKIGHVVYLKGVIQNGSNGHIATLPEGWRPTKYRMFSQCSLNCQTAVRVYNDGRIIQRSAWKNHLSLDGIIFVI